MTTLYRALTPASLFALYISPDLKPTRFEGSADSTLPAGEEVSFWFDKPFLIDSRQAWAITEAAAPRQGTMSYRIHDAERGTLYGEVDEFYLHEKVTPEIKGYQLGTIIPGFGCRERLSRDLKTLKDDASLCEWAHDPNWELSIEEICQFLGISPKESGEVELFLEDEDGNRIPKRFFSQEEILELAKGIEAFAEWFESLPSQEGEHLPL